jgi:hypothetical protein
MTNNTPRPINANAASASRYAAETNAMTFAPANAPRRTGRVRTARRHTRRTIR